MSSRGCPACGWSPPPRPGYDHLDLEAIATAGAWATHCAGYCDEEVAAVCDPFVEPPGAPVELVALDELLGRSDVVTLHPLLTPETHGMIDARALALMRPGAYLVNGARAALVDQQALADALGSGRLGGCALDVLPHEPPGPDEPAFSWSRTIINPHAAWYSDSSAHEPYRRGREAAAAVLEGREPHDVLARPAR